MGAGARAKVQPKLGLASYSKPPLQLLKRDQGRRSSLEAFHASCALIFAKTDKHITLLDAAMHADCECSCAAVLRRQLESGSPPRQRDTVPCMLRGTMCNAMCRLRRGIAGIRRLFGADCRRRCAGELLRLS